MLLSAQLLSFAVIQSKQKDINQYTYEWLAQSNDGYELLTHAPIDLNSLVIEKNNIQSKLKGKILRKALNLN
ncbi:hypothetical protein ABFY60_01570 [Lysinibacillus pakistanensis]|uniref:hypothetical protein n=1 Tax=Lysinibacillus pakistanensis TaxID=759811 RepID=UPI003D2DF811